MYSFGVYVLAILSAGLLIAFGGVTDRLIPLFAIGAFLSFTLSQAGMVVHWRKQEGCAARSNMVINAFGAVATGLTVLVVAVAKFTEGAWITLALIPALMLLMLAIRRHFHTVATETSSPSPLEMQSLNPLLVVVPIEEWNRVTKKALRFAMTLSNDIQVLHIDSGEQADTLRQQWSEWVEEPARKDGRAIPKLVVIASPYRFIVGLILSYLRMLEQKNPERYIAVVVSGLAERHWFVVNVPWYLTKVSGGSK